MIDAERKTISNHILLMAGHQTYRYIERSGHEDKKTTSWMMTILMKCIFESTFLMELNL